MKTILMMALVESCGMFKAIVPSPDYVFTKFDKKQMEESSNECLRRTDTCMVKFYITAPLQYQVLCEGKGPEK